MSTTLISSSTSSYADSISPVPPSPETVGYCTSANSDSVIARVGTWVNRARLLLKSKNQVNHRNFIGEIAQINPYQRLTPTVSVWAVARYSPVLEKAKDVQGLLTRTASIRCPVGRSHTRITLSADAAMIHRPSFEKHYTQLVS